MQPNDEDVAEIRFEERSDYLYAFISGKKDSLPIALEYWQRVIDECYRRGFKKLLVEEDFPNQISTMEMFAVTSAIPQMVSTYLRIAFVDRRAEHDDLNVFGETVALNRGVDCHVFAELSDAENWLKS